MAHRYNPQLDAYSLYHKSQESSHDTSSLGPALPALGHALAGSTGTAISNLVVYPLDLITTRLQVQRSLRSSSPSAEGGEYKGVLDAFEQIYNRDGGLSAFYSGVLQDTGKSIVDSFLFFLFYNYLRSNRLQKNGNKSTTLPAVEELVVGALAGASSKFFTTPISNIVTRKQTSSLLRSRNSSSSPPSAGPSVADIYNQILSEKGIQGFWSGYSASLVLTLNPSLTFFLYEFSKRSFLPRSQRDDPGARITFMMAAISKAVASTITYPFSLAKARAQTSAMSPVNREDLEKLKDGAIGLKDDAENINKEKNTKSIGHDAKAARRDAGKVSKDAKNAAKRSTVFNTILKIYRTEGASALYEGIWGEILKGFFSHGITMLVKESIHKLIIQTYFIILEAVKKIPSPAQTQTIQQAGYSINKGAEKAGSVVKDGYEGVGGLVGDVAERANLAGSNATEVAKNTIGMAGNNATQLVKKAEDLKSKDAGHLMGNAQEMLGDKIKDVGEGIKPVKE